MTYLVGELVEYQYKQNEFVGGNLVSGTGKIVGHTIIGNEDAYIVKPDDGSECVHVKHSGVSPREYCTDYHCAGDCNGIHRGGPL